jgi:TRAP-type C4-dicarboxylate transport system permease small subunit
MSTLKPAMQQVDPALGISNVWVMLALPIGFALLAYHQIAVMTLGGDHSGVSRSIE